MAKLRMFAIYDSKAEAFDRPFVFQTLGQALRGFTDAVKDPSHHFAKHPEDYSLFELGTYDESSALIEQHKAPVRVVTALECVKQQQ